MTTDSADYTLTYDYDNLDRVTRVTYPDGTFEQTIWNMLDPEQHRDRLGRWSYTWYDALRHPSAVYDPLGTSELVRLVRMWRIGFHHGRFGAQDLLYARLAGTG